MPDHIHLLVEGLSEIADLGHFVELAKQRSAHAARAYIRGRLWQAGYFDRVIREEDDVQDVIRYIVQNPLRARLVDRVDAYPYSGSSLVPLNQVLEHCAWKPR